MIAGSLLVFCCFSLAGTAQPKPKQAAPKCRISRSEAVDRAPASQASYCRGTKTLTGGEGRSESSRPLGTARAPAIWGAQRGAPVPNLGIILRKGALASGAVAGHPHPAAFELGQSRDSSHALV